VAATTTTTPVMGCSSIPVGILYRPSSNLSPLRMRPVW